MKSPSLKPGGGDSSKDVVVQVELMLQQSLKNALIKKSKKVFARITCHEMKDGYL